MTERPQARTKPDRRGSIAPSCRDFARRERACIGAESEPARLLGRWARRPPYAGRDAFVHTSISAISARTAGDEIRPEGVRA